METSTTGWTLGELSQLLGGRLDGPAELRIRRPVQSDGDDPEGLAFAETEEYARKASESGVGAVLIPTTLAGISKPAIRVDKPREAFAKFLSLCSRPLPSAPGIHPTAVVDPSAEVSSRAHVGAYAVVERGARIEAGAIVFPFAYIGENCVLKAGSIVYPHAVLYQDVEVGEGSIIHSGAVIGADGFGFTWNGSEHVKIPQVGRTVIGANVEVGAVTTIDRAMIGTTRVGDGTKIDNQVQIAHNTRIGSHTIIAAQAGVSGSTEIGDNCVLAGQTAVVDHVKITDGVTLTGRTAVSKDIEEAGIYRGAPAFPYAEQLRLEASQRRVPEILKRLRELEARLAALEKSG